MGSRGLDAATVEGKAGRRARRRRRLSRWLIVLGLVVSTAAVLVVEARTSGLQARFFSSFDSGLSNEVEAGPSPAITFPEGGPYDSRLGYARLPVLVGR